MDELKISIQEDATHKSLLSKGSIPNPTYNKRIRTLSPQQYSENDIKASSVETQVTEEKVKMWKSCCFSLDPHSVTYFGQFTISLAVLGISTFMLVKADGSCEKSSPYIGLISFLLGKILSSVATSTDK